MQQSKYCFRCRQTVSKWHVFAPTIACVVQIDSLGIVAGQLCGARGRVLLQAALQAALCAQGQLQVHRIESCCWMSVAVVLIIAASFCSCLPDMRIARAARDSARSSTRSNGRPAQVREIVFVFCITPRECGFCSIAGGFSGVQAVINESTGTPHSICPACLFFFYKKKHVSVAGSMTNSSDDVDDNGLCMLFCLSVRC
jgi:hypothetical protein